MQRQLANRTKAGVGAHLRDADSVAGNRALMEMSDANHLRDE